MVHDRQPAEPAEDDPPPVAEIDAPKPVEMSDLRRELTEEEKAKSGEELRRSQTIAKGLHPDTGKYLRPGDRKTLRSAIERLQFDAWLISAKAPTLSPLSKAANALLAQIRHGVTRPSDYTKHQCMIGTRSIVDEMARRDPVFASGLRDEAARARQFVTPDLAGVQSVLRQFDPRLDLGVADRLLGGIDRDLLRQAIAEPEVMRALRRQVNVAAVHRITDTWLDGSGIIAGQASIAEFMRNQGVMASEANRMLAIYGPGIAEQPRFLREFQSNIGLFRPDLALSEAARQRSDLLARLALRRAPMFGFNYYEQENVERVRQYGECALAELAIDFERDGNPVHGWEAFAVASRYRIDPPEWVEDFLTDVADRISEIRDEVAGGRPVKREAERVGKALGFGKDGPGQSGWFKHATMLERDRTVYFEINDKLATGTKLDNAYDDMARALSVSRSTIVRAYHRITKLNDEAGDRSEGEDQVS